MKRKCALIIALALLNSAVFAASPNKKAHVPVLVKGLMRSVTWWQDDPKHTIEVPLHFHCRVRPLFLEIGRDHPNGTKVSAYFKDTGVKLSFLLNTKFESGDDAFDENGDLKPGYYLQVGEYDFDKDRNPEIVVAVGDGELNLAVTVIKFHPPAYAIDSIRQENWEKTGAFEGQSQSEVLDGSIDLPFGTVGLFQEYTWVKGKFVETDDLKR
jgi:hypothetical protein